MTFYSRVSAKMTLNFANAKASVQVGHVHTCAMCAPRQILSVGERLAPVEYEMMVVLGKPWYLS